MDAHPHSVTSRNETPAAPYAPRELQIPSSHDGSLVACRVYMPDRWESSFSPDLAVVAHPYGPLGGSYDDPVVNLTARELLSAGYVVCTFNFRTMPSWTLRAEIADYASCAVFLMYFVYYSRLSGSKEESGWRDAPLTLNFIAGGYSYGSLVASHLPSGADLLAQQLDMFRAEGDDKLSALAMNMAGVAARRPNTGVHAEHGEEGLVRVKTSYLLISPLLSPTTFLLAPFVANARSTAENEAHFREHQTLAVFGTDDMFTSSKRLEKWAEQMGMESVVVEGASHFWHTLAHSRRLQQSIGTWVSEAASKREVSDDPASQAPDG